MSALQVVPPMTESQEERARTEEFDAVRARIRRSVEDRGRGFTFRRGRLRIIIRLLPRK